MEVEKCKQCNGYGYFFQTGKEGRETISCIPCNSTGRVFKVNFTKEFPFTDDYKTKTQIVNFEDKISKLIRDEKSN